MNSTEATQENLSFKTDLAWSVLFHVVVVLMFTVRAFFFPSEPISYESAIKVEIVGLPDKVKELPKEQVKVAPKATQPEAKPVTKPVEKPKVPEKVSKKAQDEALKRIKAMEALEKIETEVAKEKKAAPIAGNQISEGTALKGIQQSQIAGYIGELDKKIKDHWNLPQWLADSKLRARAVMYIDESGNVVKRAILQSSGDQTYDGLVLQAIDASAPFPPPPKVLAGALKMKGVTLGFPE